MNVLKIASVSFAVLFTCGSFANAAEVSYIGSLSVYDACACGSANSISGVSSSGVVGASGYDKHARLDGLHRYNNRITLAKAEVEANRREYYEYSRFRYSNLFVHSKERSRVALLASEIRLDELQREKAAFVRSHKQARCAGHCQQLRSMQFEYYEAPQAQEVPEVKETPQVEQIPPANPKSNGRKAPNKKGGKKQRNKKNASVSDGTFAVRQ